MLCWTNIPAGQWNLAFATTGRGRVLVPAVLMAVEDCEPVVLFPNVIDFPCTRRFLDQYSKDHSGFLGQSADSEGELKEAGGCELERNVANALIRILKATPPGSADATAYHRLMSGVLEFIFFPNLLSPTEELEIHEGRKRIDIVMENGAREGIFQRLRDFRKLPCSFVAVECKNYTREIQNPELDQLGGRFSPLRGKVGIICCRRFEDRHLFIKRCKDNLVDDRGLILPLDDERVLELLELIRAGDRPSVEHTLTTWVNELFL